MPRKIQPRYRKDRGVWQVRHNGQILSLGKSREAAFQQWRELRDSAPEKPRRRKSSGRCRTVNDLCDLFMEHARTYYRSKRTGELTTEYFNFRNVTTRFRETPNRNRTLGDLSIHELAACHLEQFQTALIGDDLARTTINNYVGRMRQVATWGRKKDHVPLGISEDLKNVTALVKGKSDARETAKVKPAPDEQVDAIEQHVGATVWAIVQFQRYTGARPSEALNLQMRLLDMSGDVWVYRLEDHKTEHLDNARFIAIGPKAQAVLQPFLKSDPDAFVFSVDAGGKQPYRRDTYYNAIVRGQDRATRMPTELRSLSHKLRAFGERLKSEGVPDVKAQIEALRKQFGPQFEAARKHRASYWHPHQLRHNFATLVQSLGGIDDTRATCGHSSVKMSEVYAERDLRRAKEIVSLIV